MSLLKLFLGRKGDAGKNGVNGLDATNTDADLLENPILDCLQPNVFSHNAYVQIARGAPATYINRYGKGVYSEPATATNYVPYSEDFSQWDDILSAWSIIGPTTDPFGGSDATIIQLDIETRNIAGTIPVMGDVCTGLTNGLPMIASFWIKRVSGNIDTVDYSEDSNYFDLQTISDSWERKSVVVGNNSASSRFGISPRGDSGAQFAVYGVQFEEYVLTDYIQTDGAAVTVDLDLDEKRSNQYGLLIEGAKQNLCHNSQDFSNWSVSDGSIISTAIEDPFGYKYALSRFVFASLPTITATTSTETLTPATIYSVSFWAYVTGGSLTSLSVALGDGAEVFTGAVSVSGWQRVELKVTTGTGDTITVRATSNALTAQLNICRFQIEEGEVSSYIGSGLVGQSRSLDIVSMDYAYNIPKPSDSWSFVFGKNIKNNSEVKTVFSNGEAGANEFSLYFQNRLLTINNGGNTASADVFDYEKCAVVYDGANVKFYGENTLISTQALSSTSFIATSFYIGSDGTGNAINGELSGCLFYNEALTDNDINYLLGV